MTAIMTTGATVIRVQIQFTEQELAALRREAAQRHTSVSAVVREAVEERMAHPLTRRSREELLQRSLAAMGRFSSGTGDVAARHDEYFANSADE
jgi:hypothetical protein